MVLNENEKQEISKEIEKLESKSSAELVAVITKKSSSYKFETLAFALFITVFISLISLTMEISAIKLFQIEVISLLFFYFLFFKFDRLVLTLLPKTYKYEKSSKYANTQFLNLGLQTTKTKQAIMFFVSIDEKYVEIITDSAIKAKIEDLYWEKIVEEFIKDVKLNNLSFGYLKAIKSCNERLIKEFPIQKDDINELSNEVIEL